jgi:predicted dehydrogenase
MDRVRVAGIADVNKSVLRALQRKYHVGAHTDYRVLLKRDLDAVVIAVPTSLHEKVALAAVKSGKHVLLEKPIAANVPSARKIIHAAGRQGVKLMIGHVERFNPVIRAIKGILKRENVISMDITRVGPLPPRVKDVGVITDLSIHDIDLARFLTESEVKTAHGACSSVKGRFEDTAMILLRMKNGVMVHLTTNWLTPYKVRTIQVATVRYLIRGDLLAQTVRLYSQHLRDDNHYLVREIPIPFGEPLKFEIASFIECILENNKKAPITGHDGLRALVVAEKCRGLKSYSR